MVGRRDGGRYTMFLVPPRPAKGIEAAFAGVRTTDYAHQHSWQASWTDRRHACRTPHSGV